MKTTPRNVGVELKRWWAQLRCSDIQALHEIGAAERWYQLDFARHIQVRSRKEGGGAVVVERHGHMDVSVGDIHVEFKQVWNNKNFWNYTSGKNSILHDARGLREGLGGWLAVVAAFYNRRLPWPNNEENKNNFYWTSLGTRLQPASEDENFPQFASNLWSEFIEGIRSKLRVPPPPRPLVKLATATEYVAATFWPIRAKR